MKLFWLAIAALVLAAAVLGLRQPAEHARTPEMEQTRAPATPVSAAPMAPEPAPVETPRDEPKIVLPTPAPEPSPAPTPTPTPTPTPVADATPGVTPPPEAEKPAAAISDAEAKQVLADLKNIEIPGAAPFDSRGTGLPPPSDAMPAEAAPALDADAVEIPAKGKWVGDKIVPVKAKRAPDGGIRLDDRFVIKGAGTKDDPYLVTWDLIVSAQETYRPRLGQTKLPQRITMLDGAHVRISGFVAYPITSANPRELLVMLNQWDGCCIGVPPTAYDAIEVKLSQPATSAQRFMTHGTLTGKLKVDPYEDGGWLLGLYLMEDAALTVDQ